MKARIGATYVSPSRKYAVEYTVLDCRTLLEHPSGRLLKFYNEMKWDPEGGGWVEKVDHIIDKLLEKYS